MDRTRCGCTSRSGRCAGWRRARRGPRCWPRCAACSACCCAPPAPRPRQRPRPPPPRTRCESEWIVLGAAARVAVGGARAGGARVAARAAGRAAPRAARAAARLQRRARARARSRRRALAVSVNGSYSVRLHESQWEVRGLAARASRPALLAALRRVQRVLLRASSAAHSLVMNVSLDTTLSGLSRSSPALGVELCECPTAYNATSCQEPAIGFWMPPVSPHLSTAAGTILITLEAAAQPCHCNGRATACHPDTGACINCTGGTAGPQCERCAAGRYGSPAAGCRACPCPAAADNFADACSVDDDSGRVHCTCKPGLCLHCFITYGKHSALLQWPRNR
ncbi:hypothetical protein ACJJTC_002769 [Scirpophaga incertulas]